MKIGKKDLFLNNHFVKNFHCEEFDASKCLINVFEYML